MPINRKRRLSASINITPLVDVLLVLITILILMAGLMVKKLPVTLPETELGTKPMAVTAMGVSLNEKGHLFLEGVPVSEQFILDQIRKSTVVTLYVDKKTTYDVLAAFVVKLQEKHPKEIGLVTK